MPILYLWAAFLMQAVTKFLYLNFLNIWYLYLGHHSMCQILLPTECWLCAYSNFVWISIFASAQSWESSSRYHDRASACAEFRCAPTLNIYELKNVKKNKRRRSQFPYRLKPV